MGFFIDSHKEPLGKNLFPGSKLNFFIAEKQWNTSFHYGTKTESEGKSEGSFPCNTRK